MKLKEVQQYLGVPRTCIYELVRQKGFPAVKENGEWHIDWKKLQRWINKEIKRRELMKNDIEKI